MNVQRVIPGRIVGQPDSQHPGEDLYRTYNFGQWNVKNITQDKSDPDKDPILSVQWVDFKVAENVVQHHTDKFEITDAQQASTLVIRRGQAFNVVLTLDRPFDKNTDDIRFVFFFGDCPKRDPDNSLADAALFDKTNPTKGWEATLVSASGTDVTVKVVSSPGCAIGIWELDIETIYKNKNGAKKKFRYMHDGRAFMLFNPWCKEDQVYMPNEEDLEEYVLNDTGRIASGNTRQIGAKEWNFGQFEPVILPCALWLMDRVNITVSQRGDPVITTRNISSFCNASDNEGILEGNWSGDYSGGVKPTKWLGSAKIVAKYWETDGVPVKYGQCWVFSGVVTTICRALGIPCRSVTNFDSAHDSDASTTIDRVVDEDGEEIEDENHDSVWNFHVWNDVWMKRPDLEPGYDGWQAIDATPQERSEHGRGRFCAGPAPLKAVKAGTVNMLYDTKFIFAEVNADRILWEKKKDGGYEILGRNNQAVGAFIKTNKPLCGWRRELADVTEEYKHSEYTIEERAAVCQAADLSGSKFQEYSRTAEDVCVEIEEQDNILIGKPFETVVKLKNTSKESRTVKGFVDIWVIKYTGVASSRVAKKVYEERIEANATKEVKVPVSFKEYFPKLVEQASFRVTVFARVQQTNQAFNDKINFRLRRPAVAVVMDGTAVANEAVKCRTLLENPLPVPLTGCSFEIEGPGGLQGGLEVKLKDVPAGGVAKHEFTLTPKKPGAKTLLASFDCNEFADIQGDVKFTVEPARGSAAAKPADSKATGDQIVKEVAQGEVKAAAEEEKQRGPRGHDVPSGTAAGLPRRTPTPPADEGNKGCKVI